MLNLFKIEINLNLDLIDSPLRSRSLFNRDPFGSRFDEFFRPHINQQSQTPKDQFFTRNSNSPAREVYPASSNNQQTESNESVPTRTESPKFITTQPTVIPNQVNQSQLPAGIPIPIKHISTSPQRTDIKSIIFIV